MVLRTSFIVASLVLLLLVPTSYTSEINERRDSSPKSESDLVEFPLNLEYLAAEFFLIGATGRGLDAFAPELVQGGPPPIGGKMANLDPLTKDVTLQYGLIAVGHLRAIKLVVKGFPRPLLNISREVFAEVVDQSFGQRLQPSFDPYANTLNYRLTSYTITLVAPTVYAGIIPKLQKATSKELAAGLLGVASGVHTSIRAYLYDRRDLVVPPYNVTVAEFTNRIAEQANRIGKAGTKSEGLLVPPSEGAEGKVSGNVIDADKDSLTYRRTPEESLRIIYGGGDERVPGALYPTGANGRIAKYYLNTK